MTGDPTRSLTGDLGVPSVTDDLASAEQLAELRGEELVWQTLLHQASAHLGHLAGYPHSRLCCAALDIAVEHIRAAEKVLRALDDVLDPKQDDNGRHLYRQYLQQRVEREQHAIRQAS